MIATRKCLRLRLRMAHVGQCEPKNNASLAIMVKCAEFGLGSGSNDKSQNACADMKSAIETNWFAVLRHLTEEKMATCPATGFGFRQVRSVGVDIQNHIRRVKAYFCIGVPHEVIQ